MTISIFGVHFPAKASADWIADSFWMSQPYGLSPIEPTLHDLQRVIEVQGTREERAMIERLARLHIQIERGAWIAGLFAGDDMREIAGN